MDHVSQKVGLPSFTEAADPNMGQEFLLQNVLGILDALLPGHSGLGSPHSNEVHSDGLFLDDKCLVQGRLQLWTKTQEKIFLVQRNYSK